MNINAKKLLFFLSINIFSISIVSAQHDYKNAIGIRVNEGAGITLRHFLDDKTSVEGIVYTRWGGINLTGLYQVNYPVFTEPGFKAYFGAGAHFGIWDGAHTPWWDDDHGTHAVIGIDGQLGLEYTFDPFPLNLAIDWKPAINLIGRTNFWAGDLGLSVRYAIK